MKSFYQIPESIKEDLHTYKEKVKQFINGEIHPTRFRAHRVPMGVYEQRQNDTYMMRIRIPAGGVTPVQMAMIADLGKKFGSGILHLTTRQDIQIHKVTLENTPEIMESLYTVGLITKGGGGNTVRNITSCALSGVCDKEPFDVSPYAIALTQHMIGNPRSYNLPRKFKISFSGCSDDCSLATINDVGFIAKEIEIEGKKVQGFSVYVAGGMGAVSKTAHKLEDFIPADEIGNTTDAIKNLFDKKGNRRNKNQARLRFLWQKTGREQFIKLYKDELQKVKRNGGTPIIPKEFKFDLTKNTGEQANNKNIHHDLFSLWSIRNATPQKQKDFSWVKVHIPLGEITSQQLTDLSLVVEKYGEKTLRTTHDQNFYLRFVNKNDLPSLFFDLSNINAAEPDPQVCDMVVCAGSSTCRLGICLSRGLSHAISSHIAKKGKNISTISDVKIYISGCPNSCGQHPIGKIGLFGAARRIGEKVAPFYSIMLGGKVLEGETTLGENVGIASARAIPAILTGFLNHYTQEKEKYSDFYNYLDSIGYNHMKSLISINSALPSYSEDPLFYTDWGSEEAFSLKGRGAGECGAGIFDMIEVDIKEAQEALLQADKHLSNNLPDNAATSLCESVVRISRALLVTRGCEPSSDKEALEMFEKEFIDTGLVEYKFGKTIFSASEYEKKNLKAAAIVDSIETIKNLVLTVKRLYDEMDDSLQFIKHKKNDTLKNNENESTPQIELFDLRGVSCPFNYVKAKLKLEMMEEGQSIEVYLDGGEPVQNVPGSLKNDGQDVGHIEKTKEGFYKMIVTKRA